MRHVVRGAGPGLPTVGAERMAPRFNHAFAIFPSLSRQAFTLFPAFPARCPPVILCHSEIEVGCLGARFLLLWPAAPVGTIDPF